jgi:hypothetical protein
MMKWTEEANEAEDSRPKIEETASGHRLLLPGLWTPVLGQKIICFLT